MIRKKIFFRNDDVYKLDRKFMKFHEIFMKEKLPIAYAVIPGKIDKETADFLIHEKKNQGLISIIQHGWMHKNNSNTNKKYEFGDIRNYDKQKNDISKGKERMKKLFGNDFENIFVPPFHRFNETTIKIIQALGFKCFSSCSDTRARNNTFADIPISVSMQSYDEKTKTLGFREMFIEFLRCYKKKDYIGILFHHEDIPEEMMKELRIFLKQLKKMENKNMIEFSKIENIPIRTNHITDICFEITNRCNLKCRMCGIWKEDVKDLNLINIKKTLDGIENTVSVSLTGGECFLHPDINKIYRLLFLLHAKKKVGGIHITTNGYSTTSIKDFLSENKDMLAPLSLGISLDGLEKNHDKQRGLKGAFRNTMKTIKTIRLKYTKVPITIKFTITPLNYEDLERVYKLSEKLGCYFEPKMVEEISEYYNRKDYDKKILEFSDDILAKIKKSLNSVMKKMKNKGDYRNRFNRNAITAIVNFLDSGNKDFITICKTPIKSLFITCNGNVYSCLYNKPIGNIKTGILEEMLSSKKNSSIKTMAMSGKCKKCLSYHGFLRDFNLETE